MVAGVPADCPFRALMRERREHVSECLKVRYITIQPPIAFRDDVEGHRASVPFARAEHRMSLAKLCGPNQHQRDSVVAKAAGPLAKRSADIGRAVGIDVHAIGRALGGFCCLATLRAGLATTLSRWCWLVQLNSSTLFSAPPRLRVRSFSKAISRKDATIAKRF